MLFNLLDNAAKYARAATAIRIQSWRERDSVTLQVLDEGEGIPAGDLEHIFDKFYRARKTDQVRGRDRARAGHLPRVHRGNARDDLGCKQIRSHRGDLHHSAADPGSSQIIGHCRMSAAPVRVLIVDDEPPIRKLLRMGLTAQGYQVLEAPDGETALNLIAEKPDIIILDLGIPDMQGFDLLRTIRARNERVPIVVLSKSRR